MGDESLLVAAVAFEPHVAAVLVALGEPDEQVHVVGVLRLHPQTQRRVPGDLGVLVEGVGEDEFVARDGEGAAELAALARVVLRSAFAWSRWNAT